MTTVEFQDNETAIYKRFYTDCVDRPPVDNPDKLPITIDEITGFGMMCHHRILQLKQGIPYLKVLEPA